MNQSLTKTAGPERRELKYERIYLFDPRAIVKFKLIGDGIIQPERLEQAIRNTSLNRPLLKSRIVLEAATAWFEYSDSIWPEFVLQEISEVEQLHLMGLSEYDFNPARGKLCRISLTQTESVWHLLIECHHLICDGLSLIWWIQEILESYESTGSKVLKRSLESLPVIDGKHLPNYKAGCLEKMFSSQANRLWNNEGIEFGYDALDQIYHKAKTNDIGHSVYHINEQETQHILDEAHKHHISVNSAITGALLLAQGSRPHYYRKSSLAVSLRSYLQPPIGRDLGFYASGFGFTTSVKGERFWPFLEVLDKKLKQHLRSRKIYQMLIFNRLIPSLIDAIHLSSWGIYRSRSIDKIRKMIGFDQITIGTGFSNLGMVKIKSQFKDIGVNEVVFFPHLPSNMEKLIGIMTFNGCMTLGITYNRKMLTEQATQKLVDRAIGLFASS
ncbi:MAG: hypothetical protein K9N35_00335 [Candidatus Marinimicrobia bacterium]|nr:hypothetical protein [Candidatus Neomarinimicrobiota bacterium]